MPVLIFDFSVWNQSERLIPTINVKCYMMPFRSSMFLCIDLWISKVLARCRNYEVKVAWMKSCFALTQISRKTKTENEKGWGMRDREKLAFIWDIINMMLKFVCSFWLLISAQVPDSDEQFVPDFHSENCEYFFLSLLNVCVLLNEFMHATIMLSDYTLDLFIQ